MNVFKDHVTEKDGKIIFEIDKKIPQECFNAVLYACKMLYKGMPFDFAIDKASETYETEHTLIIHYLPEYVKELM